MKSYIIKSSNDVQYLINKGIFFEVLMDQTSFKKTYLNPDSSIEFELPNWIIFRKFIRIRERIR